jgi:hypothetical protein
MLEDAQRSADGVAAALRFPSGSAFRNTCQRYLRATPTELRARGGALWVVDQLLATSGGRSRPTAVVTPAGGTLALDAEPEDESVDAA